MIIHRAIYDVLSVIMYNYVLLVLRGGVRQPVYGGEHVVGLVLLADDDEVDVDALVLQLHRHDLAEARLEGDEDLRCVT